MQFHYHPLCFRLMAVAWLALFAGVMMAQEAGEKAARLRINAHAALIVNRAFSNISDKEERPDQSSLIQRTPIDSGSNARVGFSLGAEILPGKTEKLRGVFGLSFTRTGAEHHYSYLEELPTSRPGFTKLTRSTEHDITEVYNAINIHAGMRNRLWENFYLTSSFIFNNPVKITRITNGYTMTEYSSNGPDTETFMEFVRDEKKVYNRGELNLSLRFNAAYQFQIGSAAASVFVFRNLGLIYTLPWWGFGLSYNLRS